MKKIDYTLLAQIIKAQIKKYDHDLYKLQRESTIQIAINFAKSAHVDGDKFLTECGVTK
jgi:hypothetical protein